jgi:hypothetical protein
MSQLPGTQRHQGATDAAHRPDVRVPRVARPTNIHSLIALTSNRPHVGLSLRQILLPPVASFYDRREFRGQQPSSDQCA